MHKIDHRAFVIAFAIQERQRRGRWKPGVTRAWAS